MEFHSLYRPSDFPCEHRLCMMLGPESHTEVPAEALKSASEKPVAAPETAEAATAQATEAWEKTAKTTADLTGDLSKKEQRIGMISFQPQALGVEGDALKSASKQ
ncbi:MAG: hypothetical protein WCL11_28645 [Verrucomicrobiota bacterium]